MHDVVDASAFILILMLMATGLALIFGLMNVINLAHGELMMAGAYTVLAATSMGLPLWASIPLAVLLSAVLGMLVEMLLIRRTRNRLSDTVLVTWGLSIVLKQGFILGFGAEPRQLPDPYLMAGSEAWPLFVIGLSLLALLGTWMLFFRTPWGLSARAAMANRSMAGCLGIDARRLDRNSFAVAAALAGLAGALLAPMGTLLPQTGEQLLVPAFLSVLIGGLGSLVAPWVGASVLGAADRIAQHAMEPWLASCVVFAFALVLILLLPRGIVGSMRRSAR